MSGHLIVWSDTMSDPAKIIIIHTEMCHLLRRHPPVESVQTASMPTDLGNDRFTRVSGIPGQLPEIGSGSNTGANLSGLNIELSQRRSEATTVESIADTDRSPATSRTRESVSESPSKLYRETVICNPGHLPGPIALPQPSTTETPGSASSKLQQPNDGITSCTTRSSVVDRAHWQLEWKSNPSVCSRVGNRNGRFQHGLGSILQWDPHRRMLVSWGENAPHQCPGTDCWDVRCASFLQGQSGNFSVTEDR